MRISLILFAALVLLGGAYFLYKQAPQTESIQTAANTESQVPPADSHHDHSTSGGASSGQEASPPAAQPLPPEIKAFDYKQETQILAQLTKEWPKSKSQLMKNVLSADLFKDLGVRAEPHTVNEILYRQMGALKVASLRVIVEQESSKAQKLKDLDHVVRNAKDETIKTIATEARKSVQEDRPFFKETVDAIQNLEKNP